MKKYFALNIVLIGLLIISSPFNFKDHSPLEGFFFDGLWHNCIGSATTNINTTGPEPVLELSNIGDTGNDGLDMWINFTQGFGYHAYLPDPNTLPHGAFVEWKYLQEGTAGFTESLVEKQEVQNNTGTPRVQFTYDASGIGASGFKVEVYNNNIELVYENTVDNNTPAYSISPPNLGDIIGFDVFATVKNYESSRSDRQGIIFIPPGDDSGMTLAGGWAIFIRPLGVSPTGDPLTKIEMRTAQTNNYKVSVERIAMFEDAVFFQALGSTRPVGAEDGNLLQLRDMDGGGDDGIRVDLGEKILGAREKVFEFEDYHITNINTNADDALMMLKTKGKLAMGGDEQEIGYLKIMATSGDTKNITADFTAVGDDNPIYQIFKDGQLVAEADNVNSLTVQDWFDESDFKTKQPGLTKYSNSVRFPKDQNMVMNGTSYTGDELRIIAEVGENIWLTKLDLLVDGIASLDITSASVFIEPETETELAEPFEKIVGDSLPNHYNATKRLGNYIFAVGYTGAANTQNTRGIVSKFDLSGNLLWTTQLTTPSSFNDIVETDESFSNFIVVGRSEPVRIGNAWQDNESIISSIDANGNFDWINHYDQTNRENMVKVVRAKNPVDPNFPIYIAGVENPAGNSTPSSLDYANIFNINNAGVIKWKNQYVIDI